ncbi:MAG TPA: hypothetical protein VH599_00460 [Ktedonobacterales bacterium]|jgi:hypothetical protein
MNDQKQEPASDSFEVEISAIPAGEADKPDEHHPTTRLAPQARLSVRARARRIALVACAFLLLFVVILGGLPDVRNQIVDTVKRFIPTPTPTLAPGADLLYLETDVPWTTITLDGHPLAPPRIGVDAPLRLARGQHVLAWTAEPFQPQQCSITVPSTTESSCPSTLIRAASQGASGQPTSVVSLHESLDTLPATQRQALTQAIQMALSGFSDIVQPGETYVTEQGETTAKQPIWATLDMQLATDDAQQACTVNLMKPLSRIPCSIEGQDCTILCPVPWQARQTAARAPAALDWLAFAVIRSSWDYATLDGQIIARDQPIDSGAAPVVSQPVLLRIGWDGSSWRVQPLFGPDQGSPVLLRDVQIADDPGCLVAEDNFGQYARGYARTRFVSGPNPAAGCLIEATTRSQPGTPAPASDQIEEYLVRFGMVLSVNDLAHQRKPHNPLANAYEQRLARQLAALPGGLTVTSNAQTPVRVKSADDALLRVPPPSLAAQRWPE